MKRLLLFFVYFVVFNFFVSANYSPIIIQNGGGGHDHSEHYATADMPEVYYDEDTDEIIIVADGFSSYYNVVIIRNTPWQTVISTQVSGYGDTIDISSLSAGSYTIVITSEFNNVFDGQFVIE